MGPMALGQEGKIEVRDPTAAPKETFLLLDLRREETCRDSTGGWLSCTPSGSLGSTGEYVPCSLPYPPP